MKKEKAIRIIANCASDYHAYLENHNLLFVFGTPQKPNFFEAVFLPRHFLHLTGVDVTEGRFSGSSDFYEKALKGKLSPDDFSLAKNGTTEMKLLVLPQLMKIHRSAKMIGDYSFTKSALYTEKLAGNVAACLGFVREDTYFIPNTALNEDIRDITGKPQQRVLAIFRKSIGQDVFRELCYVAKGVTIQDISFSEALQRKVVLQGEYEKNISTQTRQEEVKRSHTQDDPGLRSAMAKLNPVTHTQEQPVAHDEEQEWTH